MINLLKYLLYVTNYKIFNKKIIEKSDFLQYLQKIELFVFFNTINK